MSERALEQVTIGALALFDFLALLGISIGFSNGQWLHVLETLPFALVHAIVGVILLADFESDSHLSRSASERRIG